MRRLGTIILFLSQTIAVCGQHISQFRSLLPGSQETYLVLPMSHSFDYIIEKGDPLTEGGMLPGRCDFTGYVPINQSSSEGYLSINSESTPGGVTILELHLESSIAKWIVDKSKAVDFSSVGGTARNCSGGITPWGTIITCEEITSGDENGDGYNDLGWAIEIDPVSKKVVDQNGGLDGGDKLWALGNFSHENAVLHPNRRTVYQGIDNSVGYLYKFVADVAENLSSGKLFVYKGSKDGSGEWIRLNNSTITEQNNTIAQSIEVGATLFLGIEDVEINPIDGLVYLAVKDEDRVYRFADSDPISGTMVSNFQTYVGATSYKISNGEVVVTEPWGTGNDNLVFDDQGNLWVAQDGGNNYIWLVEYGHTKESPKVKIFARTPKGSEPTGLTFTPDYKYLFMSIQHPSAENNKSLQLDAFGVARKFDRDVAIVVALKENLNNNITSISKSKDFESLLPYPNPSSGIIHVKIKEGWSVEDVQLLCGNGVRMNIEYQLNNQELVIPVPGISNGTYYLRVLTNGKWINKKILIQN